MAIQHAVYVMPMQFFYPIGNTSAVCLTQDLPPGKRANCLVMGNGDARNILYTLSYERNTGFPRTYDFTFCDVEPAIVARNILLLTLLLEHADNPSPPDYWSVFYDLYVNPETLDVIRKHAKKLAELSKDMPAWTSGAYNRVIRIVNAETLSDLREYWLKYANFNDDHQNYFFRFMTDSLSSRGKPNNYALQGLQTVGRSFGPTLINSAKTSQHHWQSFWTYGSAGGPKGIHCNPLVVFSVTGGDRFAIHFRTNPLAGFHLASSHIKMAPDSPYFVAEGGLNEKALDTAQKEFQLWCAAFQDVAKEAQGTQNEARLRLRFAVADAVQFCRVLHHLGSNNKGVTDVYGRMWSAQPLRLDGEDYCSDSEDAAPLSFNVIDTSNLGDDVGVINLLTAAIPLLERSAASTLYIEMMRSYPPPEDKQTLLSELVCGDVSIMCALFGVVPAAYVNGVSIRANDEAYIDEVTPVLTRMNWKIATTLDANVKSLDVGIACNPEKLATLLYDIYLKMFDHERADFIERIHQKSKRSSTGFIRNPPQHYSRSSFVSLLAFLKTRVNVDWECFMRSLLQLIGSTNDAMLAKYSLPELSVLLHLHGVHSDLPINEEVETLASSGTPPPSTYRPIRGLLKQQNPPPVSGLVVTVPRRKLRPLTKAWLDNNIRVNVLFQINIIRKSIQHTFSSFQPIFGKLIQSQDTPTCLIERDSKGWFGSSDLHFCIYIPTYICFLSDPKQVEVQVRILHETCAMKVFGESFGTELEIFRTKLLSPEFVHLVETLPGLSSSNPSTLAVQRIDTQVSYDTADLTNPLLNLEEQTFTTRIMVKGRGEDILHSGQALKGTQISPCTVTVECGDLRYECQFPFPISGTGIQIRAARTSGWIEVIAQLLPPQVDGKAPQTLFPIVHDNRYGLTTWGGPYVNFDQLPCIDPSEYTKLWDSWLQTHLEGMFSDSEARVSNSSSCSLILEFKRSLHNLLEHIINSDYQEPRVFGIRTDDKHNDIVAPLLVFILEGVYFDHNSNTIILEASVFEGTDEVLRDSQISCTTADSITVSLESYLHWKRCLPAMAERCRNWAHADKCLFTEHLPPISKQDDYPFCGCGKGKVKDGVRQQGNIISQFATRVAISPIFAAAYLEPVNAGPLSQLTSELQVRRALREARESVGTPLSERSMNGSACAKSMKCRTCGKDGDKKCGSCGLVYYCSRECQKRDWKNHKMDCSKR